MTPSEQQPLTAEQAFGILSAAHAELVVENRLLRTTLAQANQRIAELTPKAETNVVPIDGGAA